MHLHTKFEIPISKNIGDMHQMQFLKTRSEVKFNVTVTKLWYATLCHPKMHPHTKFEIPTSNNIRDMLRTRLFLKTRSEVKFKVTVTQKWSTTLCHPKMYPHTKIGIPTSKDRRYEPDTKRDDGRTLRLLYASQSSFGAQKGGPKI